MTDTSALRAFVIGPIGDRDEPHDSPRPLVYEESIQVFEEVIEPACVAMGLVASRADQMTRSGEIPEQIFRQIRDCPVVIADLTGANPNVMYELGLRHTTGKLTVQIGERERLPFDVASIRTIMFKRSASGLVQARRALIAALATGLESGGDPVTATRVWFDDGSETLSNRRAPDLTIEEYDTKQSEPGFLEKLADMEDGNAALNQVLTTATSITEEINRIIVEGTEKTKSADAMGATSSAKLAMANRVAALLEEPAARYRIVAGEYAQSVERIEPGMRYVLGRLAEEPEVRAAAPLFPSQIRGFVDAAAGTIDSTLTFAESTNQMRKAARSFDRPCGMIASALKTMAKTSERVGRWRELIDKIPE